MVFLLTFPPPPPSLLPKNPNPTLISRPTNFLSLSSSKPPPQPASPLSTLSPMNPSSTTSPSTSGAIREVVRCRSESLTKLSDADSSQNEDEWSKAVVGAQARVVDKWGERERERESSPTPSCWRKKLSKSDPPKDKDEWGSEEDYVISGNDNGSVGEEARVVNDDDDKLMELKRCLVYSIYGIDLGFWASAEVLELINQLEVANPTPVPIKATNVLDENWVLV